MRHLFLLSLFMVLALGSVRAEISAEKVRGEAHIMKLGATAWQPLENGMRIEPGDKIKTGRGSSVKMTIYRGEITLFQNAEFNVNAYQEKDEKINADFDLQLGQLKAKVNQMKEGSFFEIKTPTSVAGIRGTVFFLWVYEWMGQVLTQLDVVDGVVDFSDLGKIEVEKVESGKQSIGKKDGVSKPKDSGTGNADNFNPTKTDPNEDHPATQTPFDATDTEFGPMDEADLSEPSSSYDDD